MNHWSLREPLSADWPGILGLANASLTEIPSPPPQDEWLANRRAYLQGGRRHQIVALEHGRLVGYAAAEHVVHAPPGEFRIFVVVAPADRRTLGTYLLRELRRFLLTAQAGTIRMLEYEADAGFLAYLRQCGFVHRKTFAMADGVPLAEFRMAAPFESLA